MMCQTLNAHAGASERAVAVIALLDDLGLEPPPPVEPLPEIDEEDVNLVTWDRERRGAQAVHGAYRLGPRRDARRRRVVRLVPRLAGLRLHDRPVRNDRRRRSFLLNGGRRVLLDAGTGKNYRNATIVPWGRKEAL